jgi:hypothetical protein
VAAARGLSIPAPDEIPSQESQRPFPMSDLNHRDFDRNLNSLTVPISSRSPSYNSDSSSNLSPSQPNFSFPSPMAASSALLRGRAKTMATLTTSSRNMPQAEMTPREMNLPKDPYVNGQPIEAYLYRDAVECPICFLYYPPYLNRTRCCDQSICSECFVQIKRPDPHPPEHADPTAPAPPASDASGFDPDTTLVSEPAACPFCVQPEFGVTYDQPPFRRGLTYVNQLSSHPLAQATPAMSSSSSLGSASGGQLSAGNASRRRTTSVSANSPTVITTDRIRPDWAIKLSTARAHVARRSAAATALHTAAYLMGNRNATGDTRNFASLGRRTILRRGTGADSPTGVSNASQLSMLALMSERLAVAARAQGDGDDESPSMVGPPRGSSRRTRVDDLEDMMLMEAIRLSLASEEERRKKEEKEAKKDAKKKSKEEKKAEKAARKSSFYPSNLNHSESTLDSPHADALSSDYGKGKSVQHDHPQNASDLDLSSVLNKPNPYGTSPNDGGQTRVDRSRPQLFTDSYSPYGNNSYRPSHLRTLSNVSSSASSNADSGRGLHRGSGSRSSFEASPSNSGVNIPHTDVQESFSHGTPTGGGAGLEPMFNFRSLAAMIGSDEKGDAAAQLEDAERVDVDTGTSLQIDQASVRENETASPDSGIGLRVQGSASQEGLIEVSPHHPDIDFKKRAVHVTSNEEMQRERGDV